MEQVPDLVPVRVKGAVVGSQQGKQVGFALSLQGVILTLVDRGLYVALFVADGKELFCFFGRVVADSELFAMIIQVSRVARVH